MALLAATTSASFSKAASAAAERRDMAFEGPPRVLKDAPDLTLAAKMMMLERAEACKPHDIDEVLKNAWITKIGLDTVGNVPPCTFKICVADLPWNTLFPWG